MSLAFAGLFLLLIIGTPLGMAFALAVMGRAGSFNLDLDALGAIPYETISAVPLVAIPLFLLVGEIMNRGGLALCLSQICDRVLHFLPARMGHIAVAASGLMSAMTGSSVATVAAIGATVGPEMTARGYKRAYSASLVAAAGLLGVLLPPSIPLILYGSVVGTSIVDLFLATLVPGLIMAGAFFATHALRSRSALRDGVESAGAAGLDRAPAPTSGATVSALLLPVFVLGGIYSGLTTPTEAAAVAAAAALAMTLIQRTLRWDQVPVVFTNAVKASAAILTIIALTSLFNRALVLNQIPQDIAAFALSVTDNPIVFLLGVNLLLLLVGMFMETNAAVMLMGPLLAPAAIKFGIDPVHFGIILVTNIEIGLITPPLAANVFVAARTLDVNMVKMLPHLAWFFAAALSVLLLISFVPELTLWFRHFQ
ncbi:TRAP transporter large permease [Bordetella bronchiseptica]|uniref:TRAP transporter large permease n=1 Tax=Bordetella bronchiseptica TaxID=518 RepID=UPI00028AC061|nr:TRAP transporter large permease [Bordetella bronchiseptica]AZW32308.1 TRAP transporter large permease [Bordetella bronchiseptica]KAK52694.1 TRAP transporter, DctM subunit [Bordetella bronchiseptica OSU054]KAK72545.1 TRAP transporter, DctM subunit [Bordetella bronchiseptica MO211]KCV43828.1 TRAP transporter, DctM subunit [Bordetella bronchiseptica 345]KCV56434.1 TRAP transporter, DctM subunit [Bordetella bronchiseptica 7E71]